jgi:hypothetical protein
MGTVDMYYNVVHILCYLALNNTHTIKNIYIV